MIDATEDFEGEELDIEPFEGKPEFDRPQSNEDGGQDDDVEILVDLHEPTAPIELEENTDA